MSDLRELQDRIGEWSTRMGWDSFAITCTAAFMRDVGPKCHLPAEQANAIAAKLALIHTEVSEATEALRDGEVGLIIRENGKPDGMAAELADVVIRVLNLAGQLGLDMDEIVRLKMDYNDKRPHRHGGKLL